MSWVKKMGIKKSVTFSEDLFDKIRDYADKYFQSNVSSCLGFIVCKFFENECRTVIDNAVSLEESKPKKKVPKMSLFEDKG